MAVGEYHALRVYFAKNWDLGVYRLPKNEGQSQSHFILDTSAFQIRKDFLLRRILWTTVTASSTTSMKLGTFSISSSEEVNVNVWLMRLMITSVLISFYHSRHRTSEDRYKLAHNRLNSSMNNGCFHAVHWGLRERMIGYTWGRSFRTGCWVLVVFGHFDKQSGLYFQDKPHQST